jgi:hypothetical protein
MVPAKRFGNVGASLQVFNAVPSPLFPAAAELAPLSFGFKGCLVPNIFLKRCLKQAIPSSPPFGFPSKRAWGRLNLQGRFSIPESLPLIEINPHKMKENQ